MSRPLVHERPSGARLPDRGPAARHLDPRIVCLCAATAVLIGAASVLVGIGAAAAGAGVAALLVLTAVRPITATYVYLATVPFLAGIDRGRLLPLVRPNEALLAALLLAALIGAYLRFLRGDPLRLRPGPLDLPLAVFVLASTLWPLVSVLLRGSIPDTGELAALLPVCKLAGLLVLVRTTVHTDAQLLRVGRIVLYPAAAVALIAVLQTTGSSAVVALLNTFWSTPNEPAERGTTTLASSIATGDYVVLALALLIALAVRGIVGRWEVLALGAVLGAGTLAAGQFSTWAAAVVVAIVMLRQHPQLRHFAVRFLPLMLLVGAIGSPAVLTRIAQFFDGFGVPRSWLGRWDNLSTFYLPRLGDFNFILGVSPNSVLQAPETWREQIFLEFGYLQFLWVGGLPLLAAFGWLSVAVLRRAREVASGPGLAGAFATTMLVAWWVVIVLSLVDIHLVLRGAGDLIWAFLALLSGRSGARNDV